MKLIDLNQFQAAVARTSWARISDHRLNAAQPARCYETKFEPNGVVGADMSACLLNEFMSNRIDSGVLQVVRAWGTAPAEGVVISYLLLLLGYRDVPISEYRFEFAEDYPALASIMSWCLACGWEFDFLAANCDFGVRVNEDELLTVFWREGESTMNTLGELLNNLSFSPTDSCIC